MTSSPSDRRVARRAPAGTCCSARAAFILVALTATLGACRAAPPRVTPGGPALPTTTLTRLQHDIDDLLGSPALDRGSWGVLVRSLARDEPLYARNHRKLLMPASGMKTVTLAAAADRLGWDFSFETRLVGVGPVAERVLDGDLVVVGTGDPSLDDWDGQASRLFETWAHRIKAAGIDTIGGRIVGHDNAIEDGLLGAGWAWDDLDRSFATSVGGLQFNQNTARLLVGPGVMVLEPATVTLSPSGSGLVVRNLLTTSGSDLPLSVQTRRLAGSAVLELRGSVPLGSLPFVRNLSVHNPTQYFVSALREGFIVNGVDVRGPAVDIDELADPPGRDVGVTLIAHRSPPLSTLATTMMKQSQNMYAETLLQLLGGPDQARAVFEGWGLALDDLVMADGSGLSRYNLATADFLVALLTRVARDVRLGEPFEAALPVAGRDGTLAERMKGTAAEGNVRAKTGSFSNARSLAGYVRTADDETLVFAIIANNFGLSADIIERTIDAIAIRLAEFRRSPNP